ARAARLAWVARRGMAVPCRCRARDEHLVSLRAVRIRVPARRRYDLADRAAGNAVDVGVVVVARCRGFACLQNYERSNPTNHVVMARSSDLTTAELRVLKALWEVER